MPIETPTDAIELLKADHRRVEDLFEEFERARIDISKVKLVRKSARSWKSLKRPTLELGRSRPFGAEFGRSVIKKR